jgi:hypothetical protein
MRFIESRERPGAFFLGLIGDSLNLPQFDGHFKKDTIEVEGVSNEKKNTV